MLKLKTLKSWTTRLLPVVLVVLLAACGTAVSVLSVSIQEEYLRLAQGVSESLTVEVAVTGAASVSVEWSTSSAAVATVDQSGVVTAVAVGTVTISAVSVEDPTKSDAVTVQVIAPPALGTAPASGESAAAVGGKTLPVTTTYIDGAMALTVGESELVVGFQGDGGAPLPISSDGVPRVTQDGAVGVSGSGFAPASAVDVWLFSEPTLLGSARADANGDFSTTHDLPDGITLGEHSLVIQGTTDAGDKLMMKLGVEVQSGASLQEFAHCPAASDWFVSAMSGANTASGTSIGEPVASIQAAVDAAAPGDAVCVSAGTYAVDNSGNGAGGANIPLVEIDKPLAIFGPNAGIAGFDERLPEAKLVVSSSEADTLFGFAITASDVVIDGFYITTLTPKTDPFPDGIYGVWVSPAATQGVSVRNNHLVDTNFPIWVNRGRDGGGATGFTIQRNLIEGPNAESDQGIIMQAAFGDIRDNEIRDARVGIQVQPYQFPGSGVVVDNDIEAFQAGLWFNYQEDAGASWVFEDNTVLGVASPWGWPLYNSPDVNVWSGIRIETFVDGTVTFQGNSVAVGTADPPAGDLYLLRQLNVTGGEVSDIGTVDVLGALFTSNTFPDFGTAGVTTADLSDEGGQVQLRAPTN